MKTVAAQALALLLAGAVHAQTATPQSAPSAPLGRDLTHDLNAGPPAPATYLASPPAPVAPALAAQPAPQLRPGPAPAPAPSGLQSSRSDPIPTTPAPRPRTVPITPSGGETVPGPLLPPSEPFTPPGATPAPAPTVPVDAVVTPPLAAAPAVTVLDAAARAALPFSVDLPPGFEIVTGRPGPDFRIYTIRRSERSFAMIYAGPASQFPIYSGQMIEAGGRASVVSTENGVRHAQEHLFQRPTAPLEVHIWVMSLDGGDRALAEQIAQSLDVR